MKEALKPRICDIPKYTRTGNYRVDCAWSNIEKWLDYEKESGLNLNPDFQRPHVWTEEQQSAYVLYRLRGGYSGDILYWNSPNYTKGGGNLVIVDGKQRLEAVRKFMRNELVIWEGLRLDDFADEPDMLRGARFTMVVNDLKTRKEVLTWYLDLNTGGTPHTQDEIEKVMHLLSEA